MAAQRPDEWGGDSRETVGDLLPLVDGAVVGTALKVDGITWNPVDPERVQALMAVVRAVRVGR